jgi:hypothetical protein
VNTLKEHVKAQNTKLDKVCTDVDGAKAALKMLRWAVGVMGSLLAILLAAYLQHVFSGK